VGFFTIDGITPIDTIPSTSYTIVRYIDSHGCTPCKLHLHQYDDVLSQLTSIANTQVGLVCIVNTTNIERLSTNLRYNNRSKRLLLIDEQDSINKANQFPSNNALRTFLIDSSHKVLAIGDPAVNPKVLQYYSQVLSSKK
jgi:hypothetical protein